MNWLRYILLLTVIVLQPWSLMADDGSPGDVLTPADTIRIPATQIQLLNSIDETTSASTVVPSFAPVTIAGGGAMTLVSPHSVVLKPGTRVEAGGKLIVKVTPADPPKRNKRKVTSVEVPATLPQKSTASVAIEKTFCVYPLPESGSFSALLNEIRGVLPARTKTTDDPDGFIILKKCCVQIPQSFLCTKSFTLPIGTRWGEHPGNIRVMRT
ncbi:MAG TPA: hypothetical protein PKN44_10770 [Bacteroidales bacterium]|nr:hypothetical protein [Bacteroidales bacterium]HPS51701.1 hypothetical protein [Bacteroidales bacterium]